MAETATVPAVAESATAQVEDVTYEIPLAGWADPMLTVPKLAQMACKKEQWIRDHLRGEDPIPHYSNDSLPRILWSDYVAWYKRRYAVGSPHYGEDRGKK